MAGKPDKDILQPGPDINAGGFGGGEHGVHDGRTDGGLVIAGEEEVLSPQSQGPDGILDAVVVNAVSAVQHIATEAWQKGKGIDKGSGHLCLGNDNTGSRIHPPLEVLDDGVRFLLAALLDGIVVQSGFAHLFFYLIELADVDDCLACVLPVPQLLGRRPAGKIPTTGD